MYDKLYSPYSSPPDQCTDANFAPENKWLDDAILAEGGGALNFDFLEHDRAFQ